MKDKIVVAPHQIDDYYLDIQSVGYNGAEEYIRKEALLEWAKESRDSLGRLSYGEFIDKLNSM